MQFTPALFAAVSSLLLTTSATPLILSTPFGAAQNSTLLPRDPCSNGAGECVTYFGGSNCYQGSNPQRSYKPTCGGNCFQYSTFKSLYTIGSTVPPLGTACQVYSDTKCQNELANIKNSISSKCTSFSGGNSMRCWYDCWCKGREANGYGTMRIGLDSWEEVRYGVRVEQAAAGARVFDRVIR
jgi:hypothetical protein